MNIDKSKLEALSSLSDEALWAQIRSLAQANGIKLPNGTPPHEELERLREICRDQTKLNMLQAMRIVNSFKRGK